jgi:hypothetical protein
MAERMPGDPNVPLIPVQGKGMQAFGERVGREYVTDPYRAAADVGLSVVAGMPLPLSAAQRALQARQSRTLSQAANFDPAFRQRLAQAETQPIPSAPGPIAPSTSTALTVQGPGQQLPPSVIPMSGPQRNVNIEGQSFQLPNQINTANSQAARPQMQGPTPQQMAIQKTQEIVAQRQQPQPQPQARTPQPKPAPKPTPAVKGLRSSAEVRKELDMVSRQSDSLYSEGLESGVKYGTPEGESRQAQLGQLYSKTRMLEQELEQVLKAEKTASKKKAPSNVSQMLTEDMVFDTKAEWDKANLLNTLADKKPIGGYRVGNGIVRHEVQDYSSVPEALRSQLPKISIVKRTPKGKRITE